MSTVLNEKYNTWYRNELRTFIIENDVKHYPERICGFIFDLNEQKIDTIKITDDELAVINIPARTQTTADIHCIGTTTVKENRKKIDY